MKYRHFGKANQKRSLLRGLVLGVLKNGGINTYEGRAKDAQRLIEKIVREARKNTVVSKRKISSLLAVDSRVIAQFYAQVLPGLEGRISGFTRIIRLGQRKGDGSYMARLEWVAAPKKQEKELKNENEKVKTIKKKEKIS